MKRDTERHCLSLVVTPEGRDRCHLACPAYLPAILPRLEPGPHVSTSLLLLLLAARPNVVRHQELRTQRALGRNVRPPFHLFLCVCVCMCPRETTCAIGFRVRLQIAEALTSSRFSCMQLRMILA